MYLTPEINDKVIQKLGDIKSEHKSSVMALGNFDGIHIGHQELLKTTVNIAKTNKVKSSVLTFNPHPVQVLRPNIQFQPILELADKINLLLSFGVDYIFIAEFNQDLIQLNAPEFIKEYLCNNFAPKHLVTGFNFHFGKNKGGDVNLLTELSHDLEFTHTVIKEVQYNYQTVSTSNIKSLLSTGRIETANAMLARNFQIKGVIVEGEGLATKHFNIPTANILLSQPTKLPLDGVYTIKTYIDNKEFFGIANLGVKPTLSDGSKKLLEVHLFGFNNNLYDKTLAIELLTFLRPERKFEDLSMLKYQIDRDIQNAHYVIKNLK